MHVWGMTAAHAMHDCLQIYLMGCNSTYICFCLLLAQVLDVHEKIVPRILGREGRIHRDIEEACGCNIHIHEAQNGMQLVLIRGSIAQVSEETGH